MSKYTFSITQILLSFSLGVFGNKLAEIINVPPAIIIVGTCLLIGLSIILESIQHQAPKERQSVKTASPTEQFRLSLKLNRIVTVFPFGMIAGALLALFSFYFFPYPKFPKISVRLFSGYEIPGYGPYIYECVAYVGAIILAYVISSRKQDPSISYAFSIGYAWGMSAAILSLDPYINLAGWTYIGWSVTIIITTMLVIQIKHVIKNLLEGLFKERE